MELEVGELEVVMLQLGSAWLLRAQAYYFLRPSLEPKSDRALAWPGA